MAAVLNEVAAMIATEINRLICISGPPCKNSLSANTLMRTGMAPPIRAHVASGSRIVGPRALRAGAIIRSQGVRVVAIERTTSDPITVVGAAVVSRFESAPAARTGSSAHLLGWHRSNK